VRLRRKATPVAAQGAQLEVRLDRERYAPGETVRGSIVVVEGRGPGEIAVSLNFHERSTEYEAVAIETPRVSLHRGDLIKGSAHRFAIALPEDAPPSQTTVHGALWWAVDASAGEPGASPVVSRRIEVQAPAGARVPTDAAPASPTSPSASA